jgi:hypothetical protein
MTLRLRPLPSRHRSAPAPVTGPGWVPTVEQPGTDAPYTTHGVRVYTTTEMIVGTVRGQGRLSDILNLRAEVRLEDATMRSLGGAAGRALTVHSVVVDAFEIEIAMANRLPDESWTRARRVHKIRYPVRVDAAPYTIEGSIHVFPGMDPRSLAKGNSGCLFIPVTRPVVRRGGRLVSDPTVDAVLVNRHLVRAIEQADVDGVQDAAAVLMERRALALA